MKRADLLFSGSKSNEDPITLEGLSQANSNFGAGRSNRFAELLSKVEANI